MTDKLLVDSNNFEALAYGVFDSAPDVDSGRAALIQAYDQYDWSDKAAADKTLEYYGEQLKYKHKDQSSFNPQFLENSAPVKLSDIPLEDLKNDQELYTKWDEANQAYLGATEEPQYLVAKKQLSEDIKAHAASQRRAANATNIEGNIGSTAAKAVDLSNRFLQGAAAGVEPYINSAVNIFADGYELNSHLTELTDPRSDGTFISDLAGAAGNVSGTVLSGAVAGPAGVFASSATQAVDAIGTRYDDTKNKTGDSSAATEAATIEAGSQVLQLAGEQVVFGKIANRILGKETEGSLIKSVIKSTGVEAVSEGSGQYISNQAEDVQKQEDNGLITSKAFRGVGRSALLGGVLAGGVDIAVRALPSKANTNVRKDEIVEDGFPSTPAKKQVVGEIRPGGLSEDSIPGETESIDTFSPEQRQELRDRGLVRSEEGVEVIDTEPTGIDLTPNAIDTQTTPDMQPAYTTDNGDNYFVTDEGHYIKAGELPHDKTLFVDDKAAQAIATAIQTGEHIVLDPEGNPAIERVNDTGETSLQPIAFSTDPIEGSYPLGISEENQTSNQEKVRPVKLGQRIKEVTLDRSIGAFGNQTITQKETTYSQKLRNSSLPTEMKSVGEKGIYYTPYTQEGLSREVNSYVDGAGIEKTISSLSDPTLNPILKNGLETYLHNFFEQRIQEATDNGDVKDLQQLGEDFKRLAPDITGTEIGQAFAARRGKTKLGGLAVVESYQKTYEDALVQEGKDSNTDPLEIGQSDKTLKDTDKAIKVNDTIIKQEEENQQTILQDQVDAYDTVINDLEGKAQKKIDKKIDTIEKEQARIQKNIEKLSKSEEASDKKLIEEARKRLQYLNDEKANATIENNLSDSDKEKYKKYIADKEKLTSAKPVESEGVKAAKQKIADLEKLRKKAEKLNEKKKRAEQKAIEAARRESENQSEIQKLKGVLENGNLNESTKNRVQADIAAKEGINETLPERRDAFMRIWVSNLIGAPYGILVGTLSSVISPIGVSLKLSGSSLNALIGNVAAADINKYQIPLLGYWKGLLDSSAYKRGVKTAGIALWEGLRVENSIPRNELVARTDLKLSAPTFQTQIRDYVDFAKSLEYKKDISPLAALQDIGVAAQKLTGWSSGKFLRVLMAAEAFTTAIHYSGFDRATAAFYYNKAKGEGVTQAELDKYRYSPKENWAKAQAEAKNQTDRLRESGIETSSSQEFISAIEKYQAMPPREIQVSTYKASGSTALNTPATGMIGVVADAIQNTLKIFEPVPVLNKVKYLAAFTNSVAVQMGNAVEYTPLGAIGLLKNDVLNRTEFERSMMISGAITGTSIAAGIALKAIQNLDLPEDERFFDIIGMYSSNKAKRDAFVQAGGTLFSLKFGNTYVPFGETPFVLALGGAAAAVDRVRDGKDPDPDSAMSMVHSGFTMAASMGKGLFTMSMLKGVSELASTMGDALSEKTGSDIKAARILTSTVKGFIPAASILRTISRYTDNPVDAKKDFASAIFEGIPVLQSQFGKPALNIMGEPIQNDLNSPVLKIHRVFSSKSSDVDMRWLADKGYTLPSISNMRFAKDLQGYVAKKLPDEELDYNLKYEVYRQSAGQMRDIVGRYREKFGVSAKSEKIQDALNADVRRILATNSAKVLLKK